MFGNLIESGSHAADLKRKGRFFLGTSLFYALLLAATGVGSIYAYNSRLEQPNDEYVLLALMHFPPAEQSAARHEEARPAASRNNQIASRTNLAYQTPYHDNNIAPVSATDVSTRARVIEGPYNSGTIIEGPVGPVGPAGTGNYTNTGGPVVKDIEGETAPPAIVKPTPAPPQTPTGPVHLSSSVITSKAISKPAPPYPVLAKHAGIQGPVSVQIWIDEQGRVTSAKATSGNALLQTAAVQAAYKAIFTPTTLNGQPVKVTGVITYNFVLQ
jgi:periplasmic protein TonB